MTSLNPDRKLLEFLWRHDTHVYRRHYERNRLQISLLLSLIRPRNCGLILSTRGYYQSTSLELLLYNNISICLVPRPDGTGPIFQATFTLTNLKGRRGIDRTITKVTLQEDRQSPCTCPVLCLLALSLHDGAFAHARTPKDLFELQVPKNQQSLSVPWKPAFKEKALLRNFHDIPWKFSQAVVLLNDLQQRVESIDAGSQNQLVVFRYPAREHLARYSTLIAVPPTNQPEVGRRVGVLIQLEQLVNLLRESNETEEKTKTLKQTHNSDRFDFLRQESQQLKALSRDFQFDIQVLVDPLSGSESDTSSLADKDRYSQNQDEHTFYHSKWSKVDNCCEQSHHGGLPRKDITTEIIWCDQSFHCQWTRFCPFVLFGPDVPGGDFDFRMVLEDHITDHIVSTYVDKSTARASGSLWKCRWKGCRKLCCTSASLISHAKKKHIPLDERSQRVPLTDSTAQIQRRFRLDDYCLIRLQYITNTVQEEQAQALGCVGISGQYRASEDAILKFLHLFAQEVYPPLKELGPNRKRSLARWALARTSIVNFTPSH